MRGSTRQISVVVALMIVSMSCSSGEKAGDVGSSSSTAVTGSTNESGGTSPELLTGPSAPPPAPPAIIPLLRTTGDGDQMFGGTVAWTSQVLAAEPIVRLELWFDTEMVDSRDFVTPAVDPTSTWSWTPDSVGLHVATVRAFDAEGRAVSSFPSWIRVEPGWDVDTGRLLGGLRVSPLESASGAVSIDAESCEATVLVAASPGSLGQAVTGTALGVGGYRAIAVVGEAGGSVRVPLTSSPVLLSVEPYDSEQTTSVESISIPGVADCASGSWTGALAFSGATLVGVDGVDNAYLYVTDDGSTWRRVPDVGFVARGATGFDFGGLLPAVPSGGFVEVEAWGWGGEQLRDLGRARYDAQAPASTDPIWGSAQPVTPFSSLNIVRRFFDVNTQVEQERLLLQDIFCVDNAFNAACGPSPQTLRWNSFTLGAEAGLIQVSSSEPPTGPALSFPGLLWSTMIAMDGDPVRDFPLDLAAIRGGTELPAELDTGGATVATGNWFQMADLDGIGRELSVVSEPAAPGVSPRMSAPVAGTWETQVAPSRLWVRVVPFTNGVPIAGSSNAVLFETEGDDQIENSASAAQAAFDALYDVEVEFNPPQYGSTSYSHCVRVVSNPFGDKNPVPDDPMYSVPTASFWTSQFDAFRNSATVFTEAGEQKLGLVPGATVCAYKPKPPDKDLFDYVAEGISFIGQAWDTFKDLVDMVKSGVIQGIVDITGCTPEKTCVAALTALADAGLASIGVPPSLPSFRELVDAAKGDIAAALAEELVGEVCPIACEAFAKQFIEDALDDIEEHFSGLATAQAQSGGWVLHLHPDIRVIPEPAGQLFPGSVMVRITRKAVGEPGPNTPTSCSVSLRTDGSGPLSWRDKFGNEHENEVVSGPVFAVATGQANLVGLDPGESVTIGVAGLDFDRHFYLPFTGPSYAGYYSRELLQAIELWRDPDTVLVMTVSTCEGTYTETVHVKTTGTTPADIPTS